MMKVVKNQVNFYTIYALLWGFLLCLPGNTVAFQIVGPLSVLLLLFFRSSKKINLLVHQRLYVLFCFFATLSCVYSGQADSKYYVYILILPVIIYFSMLTYAEFRSFGLGISLLGVLFGLYSFLLFDKKTMIFSDSSIRLGFGKNPNALAFIVSMSALFLIIQVRKPKYKLMVFVFSLFPILMTRSKTGLGVLIIGSLTYFLMSDIDKNKKKVLLILVFILIGLFLYLNYNEFQSFFQLDSHRSLADGTGRKDGWLFLISEYLNGKWDTILIGNGSGAATLSVKDLNSSAHNAWIAFLYDFGLIGFFLQLLLFATSFKFVSIYFYPLIISAFIQSQFEINYIGLGSIGSIILLLTLFHSVSVDQEVEKNVI